MNSSKSAHLCQALFKEHSFITLFRFNFHKIDDNFYRSAQPNPWQLRKIIKKKGIKTVLNLRGEREENRHILALEKEVCQEEGVTLENIRLRSRGIPSPKDILAIQMLLDNCTYPMLIHCKSGADRTGLVSTLYLHLKKGIPLDNIHQLDFIPYGHIKASKAGLIDHYFAKFKEYKKNGGEADLIEWTTEIMDKKAYEKEFTSASFLSLLNDKLLRRE